MTPTVSLRDYQEELYRKALRAIRTKRRVLMQLPTGGGKTVLATAATADYTSLDFKVWFVCHRVELVLQTSQTFAAAGIPHSFIAAGRAFDPTAMVQICSIDTLKARAPKLGIKPDLIILDEAHHVGAAGWAAVMNSYPDATILGLSATPVRLDGSGLNEHFDVMVCGPTVAWLIERGFLSQYRVFAPSAPDLSGVHNQAGDFKAGELEEACNKPALIGDAVAHYKRLASGLRTVTFAVSIKHSQDIAAAFNEAGIPAAHVDGNTPAEERAELIQRFARGEIQNLCSVALIGEGFDLSAIAGMNVTIDCVILMRPTQSLSLYLQQVGRALRPAEGKIAIILDHAGNSSRHGLPDDERTWSLEGKAKQGRKGSEDDGPAAPFTCLSCFNQVRRPTPENCPCCGAEIPVKSRMPELRPGELREITRAAKEAEKAAKAAAKEAAKQEREARKAEEAREREAAKVRRRNEEYACKTMQDLIDLGKARGYDYPRQWASQQLANRPALRMRLG